MRRLLDAAAERVIDHVLSLPEQAAGYVEGGSDLAAELREPLPEQGDPVDDVLDLLFDRAIPKSFNTAGPGYLAYVPGGGLFHTAIADFIADAVNRYTGVWVAAPGLVQLETNVIRWLAEIVGLPPGSGGYLSSGGSLANFSAVVAARCDRLPENFLAGTIYASDQIHHSIVKAAGLAGFPGANIRIVASDDRFRLRIDELAQLVDADRAAGATPFLVAASAGTTNSGAVDELPAIADLCERERLWMHVDAAYGGFFCLTERGRRVLRGIERADSVVLDPHKGLFLPYGTGCLLVRKVSTLERAHRYGADYMPPMLDDPEHVDLCNVSPELSRAFRGLRVWLPLKLLGVDTFRRALDEKLDLARYAADRLRTLPDIEIVAEPELSLVAFRWRPPAAPEAVIDDLNHRLIETVNAKQRVWITGTKLSGRFTVRLCILSFRTHSDRVDAALEDLVTAIDELEGSWLT